MGEGDAEERLRRWESVVDRAIREAQERGEFDNLAGAGERLRLEENPFAGDRATGFRMLKNAEVLPEWMEREREMVAERATLDRLLGAAARESVVEGEAVEGNPGTAGAGDQPGARRIGPWAFVGWLVRRQWESGKGGQRDEGSSRHRERRGAEERLQARSRYLAAAKRLDGKIARYNEALPDNLRWKQRPRVSGERAAEAFDAATRPGDAMANPRPPDRGHRGGER